MTDEIDNSVDAAAQKIAGLLATGPADEGGEDESTEQPKPAPQKKAPPADEGETEEETTEDEEAPTAEDETETEPPEPEDTTEEKPNTPASAPPSEDVSRSHSEAAKPSAEELAARHQLQQANDYLSRFVPGLEVAFARDFGDIKTYQDQGKLAAEDPDRYNQFAIRMNELNAARGQQAHVANVLHQQFLREEQAELYRRLPELADETKGQALKVKLVKFAKAQGYLDEQIANASARDILMIHKAMKADDMASAQAASQAKAKEAADKARQKAAVAPPVQKPGTRKATDKGERVLEDFKRLQKTGDVRDAANVFSHFIGQGAR